MARKFNVQMILDGIDKTKGDFNIFKKNITSTQKLLVIGTAAFIAFNSAMVLSTKKAIAFEKQMANVNTMLSEQDSKFLKPLAADLRQLSTEYGEATDTLSDGLYNILSASVPAAQSIDVLRTSVMAATAGMTDTGIAADAITTILNSFQIEASKSLDVADLLFAVVKRGKTTFGELASSIGMVTSSAATAGLSVEEMGAALATMTRAGLNTAVATTSLNAILMGFLKPTDDAKTAAKKFGFELNKNTLETIGFAGVLEKLKNATAEETAAIFPNIRALKGFNAIMQQSEGFAKDLDIMLNRAGSTQEAFAKMSETTAFQIDKFKAGIADLGIEIGTSFLPQTNKMIIQLNDSVIPALKDTIIFFKDLNTIMGQTEIKGAVLGGMFPVIAKSLKGIVDISIAPIRAFGKAFEFASEQASKAASKAAETIRYENNRTTSILVKNNLITTTDFVKSYKNKLSVLKNFTEETKKQYDNLLSTEKKAIEESIIARKRAAKAAGVAAAAASKVEDARVNYLLNSNQIELEQYQEYLNEKLLALGEFHSLSTEKQIEFYALKTQLANVQDSIDKKRMMTFKQAWIKNLQELKKQQINWYNEIQKFSNSFQNALSVGFQTVFKNIGSGWEALTKGMKAFGDALLNSMITILADLAANWVLQHGIMIVASKAWALAAWLGARAIVAAKIIAGWATIPFVGAALGIAAAAALVSEMDSKFKMFATGVRGFGGGTAIVGERGEELINLPAGADVYNNQETRNIINGGGSKSRGGVNLNISFLNNTFLGTIDEISEAVSDTIFEKLELNAIV
jgi:TP901 family phage tail tape measure protein